MGLFKTSLAALALASGVLALGPVQAQEDPAVEPPHQNWSFSGIFGTIDKAAAQRGFQIYNEVCSACHSMNLLSYRNLQQLGFSEDQVKAIAAARSVPGDPNDQGEVQDRPALPSDRFVPPFANEQAARFANNGALPPDLSVMAEAREGGPDHIFCFLTGFRDAPADVTLMAGMNYNICYPGHQTAMPNILTENAVTYTDGTAATVEQEAHDVATFLTWAAEPNLDERKQTGVKVTLFLVVFAGMMYAVKRKVWARLH